jgi:hypothetical protein
VTADHQAGTKPGPGALIVLRRRGRVKGVSKLLRAGRVYPFSLFAEAVASIVGWPGRRRAMVRRIGAKFSSSAFER